MISLGPEFAPDFSADAAAVALQGAAAADGAPTELFDAVLGELMGGASADPGDEPAPETAGVAAKDPLDAGGHPDVVVPDTLAFINPLLGWPVPDTNRAWSRSVSGTTGDQSRLVSGTDSDLSAVSDTGTQMLPLGEVSPLTPLDSEKPLGADALDARVPNQLAEASIDPRPASSNSAGPAVETRPEQPQRAPMRGEGDAEPMPQTPGAPAGVAEATVAGRALATDPAKNAEPPAAPVKGAKPRSAPRIDAPAVKPVPFQAVERAYADTSRDASNTFDAPKEQPAPLLRPLQAAASPAPAPSFVMTVDARPALIAPAPMATPAIDAPASIDADIDTYAPPQIVQSIRLQAANGGGEAVIRLRPEYLGEVVVAVKVEHGAVTASLQADTPAVRQWVERNEPLLRQALAEHGLQLERLHVSERAAETSHEGDADRREPGDEPSRQQPQRRRRQQDEDATFEVNV